MKNQNLVLGLYLFQSFLFIQILFAQWEVRESGVTNDLHDVCFVDSLYGWAVGDSGTVISTADGGNTWTRQTNPVDTLDFRKVKFVDRYVGFVGGDCILKGLYRSYYNAIILKTVDGGANWVECDLGQNQELYFTDMEFSDINKGWVLVNIVGASGERGGILLSTENGGNDWSIQLDTKPYTISSIAFWGNDYGYYFSGSFFDNFDDSNGSFSEDGGETWTQVGLIYDRIRKASFYSKDTLWAIGEYTWKSEDAGITWNWFHPDVTDDRSFIPLDIHLFDSNRIWLIGITHIGYHTKSGVLISTDDCGENWVLELDIPYEGFNVLEIEELQHAWIVGGDGLILYRDLTYITSIAGRDNVAVSFELKQNYPNPFNPKTMITYELPVTKNVELAIYNLTGQKVVTLVSEKQNAGVYQMGWDATGFGSGIYYYQIKAGEFQQVKKMVLVK